jgi:hypothetical protein
MKLSGYFIRVSVLDPIDGDYLTEVGVVCRLELR